MPKSPNIHRQKVLKSTKRMHREKWLTSLCPDLLLLPWKVLYQHFSSSPLNIHYFITDRLLLTKPIVDKTLFNLLLCCPFSGYKIFLDSLLSPGNILFLQPLKYFFLKSYYGFKSVLAGITATLFSIFLSLFVIIK